MVVILVNNVTNVETQPTVYHIYFLFVMAYGVAVLCCSTQAENIIKLQTRTIRIMKKVPLHTLPKELFKKQYIVTIFGFYSFELAYDSICLRCT